MKTNRYLEKIAGLDPRVGLAGLAGVGAISAGKDNRIGGAASGLAAGTVGAGLGAFAGAAVGARLHLNKNKNVIESLHKMVRYAELGTIGGGAGGAYLGGLGYKKAKE
jgi:hypothetical protein